ncbi:hypothetical protein BV898_18206 [Hypsibius exemplaris]|uniref:Uncharacterized protein n=1 Tax=Hypsibius exemplaris TaxID=2072580 RepID=A0A9X6NH65_HYPEX|nr:hypothetical protein BV898_18206 [Hypsibius exemplaris]
MQTSGQSSLTEALRGSNKDVAQKNNIPDVIGGIEEVFTGWRTFFISILFFVGCALCILITCKICGPKRILAAICPKRRKPNKKDLTQEPSTEFETGTTVRLPALENGERSQTKPEEVPLTEVEVSDMTTERPYGLNIIP